MDNIKSSVVDGIRKQNINIDERKLNELLESVIVSVEQNRPTKTKTYIKRTKGKNEKKQNNNNQEESDDELPKYSNK